MQSPATPHRHYERVAPTAPQRPSRPSPSPFPGQPPRIAPWHEASRQLQIVTGMKGCTADDEDCTLPPLRSLGLDDPFGFPAQPPSLGGQLGLTVEHTRSHARIRSESYAPSCGSSSASETDVSTVCTDTEGQVDALQALAASARYFQPPTHAPAASVASPRLKTLGSLSPTEEFDDRSGRFLSPLANLKLDDVDMEGSLSPHFRHRRTPSSPAALQPNFAQSTQTLPPISSINMVRSRSNSGAARHPCCGEQVQWRRRNAYVLVPISAFSSERHLPNNGAARNERQRQASPLQHAHAPYAQVRGAHHHHPYSAFAPPQRSASPLSRSASPCQPQLQSQLRANVPVKRTFP